MNKQSRTRPETSRRNFLSGALKGSGALVVTASVVGCGSDSSGKGDEVTGRGGDFLHGVASGDPQASGVILWTRVTPEAVLDEAAAGQTEDKVEVQWEVATDVGFQQIIASGNASTHSERDYTLKMDVQGLIASTQYFYRFKTSTHSSPVGVTKTLPQGAVSSARFAVVSCSNYPAGYFHVYEEVAKQEGLDAVIHLGDYLYEYARGEYASDNAAVMAREVLPEGELLTVDDYRMRYAQYRTDAQLQAAHAAAPFICIWDDHEVANDTWREGAENHNEGEGAYEERLQAALQAYAEWMPIRPPVDDDIASLQRNFEYGDLLNLAMLDTRLVGRDKQLDLTQYMATGTFDGAAYAADISDPARTLLGSDQLNWLTGQLSSGAKWQVLGQQVLMGTMELPAAVVSQQLSLAEFAELAQLAAIAQTVPETLTPEQLELVQQKAPLLTQGNLPYNLDAWDGYPVERAAILNAAKAAGANLVVLAGDTHNAWANQLSTGGDAVGVELATASISSPGLEYYLQLTTEQAVVATEAGLVGLIEGLKYANLSDRGYLDIQFTHDEVTARFVFVDSIKAASYSLLAQRGKALTVSAGANELA